MGKIYDWGITGFWFTNNYGAVLTSYALYRAVEKGVAKRFSQKTAQKTAQLATSSVMGGVSLGSYTLVKESLNNVTNPMRDATSWETWKQTGIASAGSFGFGAFGGILSTLAIAPVVKAIEKPAAKATQAVAKTLSGGAEVSGKEIIEAAVKSGELNFSGLSKMSIEELKVFGKELATKGAAKGTGFFMEVGGFTLYEVSLDMIKDLMKDHIDSWSMEMKEKIKNF